MNALIHTQVKYFKTHTIERSQGVVTHRKIKTNKKKTFNPYLKSNLRPELLGKGVEIKLKSFNVIHH